MDSALPDGAAIDYVAHEDTDVLLTGDRLRPGMVVLPESAMMRGFDGYAWSMWATVIETDPVMPADEWVPAQCGIVLRFADGTLRHKGCAVSYRWIVRRDSITTGRQPWWRRIGRRRTAPAPTPTITDLLADVDDLGCTPWTDRKDA